MSRMAATRDGYGQALLELAENDKVVVLEADLGKSTKSLHFRKAHPERTISCGIGEQNMLLVAAGMASSGYIPFASTFAIFTERAFEQMRNGVARPNLAVHVCGSHGGTHTGTDGSSAQSIEDLAIYRTLPNVTVLHPCDDVSTRLLTKQLAESDSPSYMRTARNKTPVLYDDIDPSTVQIGKGIELLDGADVAIIACGVLVSEALKAADALSEQGIHATVIDMHTIKPLDTHLVDRVAVRCGAIVTAEDHSVIGGLGGAVAEHLSASSCTPLERVGVNDRFGESGQADEMLELMELSAPHIVKAAQRATTRK
ncbi:MAG: transketolase C-terminal domain-containing protein [Candidatus Thermoplasmatota archaeon]|nr:transketolase C-terminal domain-containing protein [Candidatus Thermoplasmatota archaeon]